MTQNRAVLLVAAAVALVLVIGGYVMFAGNGSPAATSGAQNASEAGDTGGNPELAHQGPMGDLPIGSPDAPVTMIEYASLTCSHCASFHVNKLPKLMTDYVETGKLRIILREFPFDSVATAGFMLARCAGPERRNKFVDVLFETQAQWAFSQDPTAELEKIAKQGGFSSESFQECLKNAEVLAHVRDVQTHAYDTLEVRSTPTFFINGERLEGDAPYEDFKAAIERHLPK